MRTKLAPNAVVPLVAVEETSLKRCAGRPKGSLNKPKLATAPKAINAMLEDAFNWRDCLVSVVDKYESVKPILSIGGCSYIMPEAITTIVGKAKSCKTTFATATIAAMLKGEYMNMTLNTEINPRRPILYVDTEQSEGRTLERIKKIQKMVDLDDCELSDKLFVLSIKRLSVEDRIEVVKKSVDELNPILAVIDGIKDLVYDINNPSECSRIGNVLMNIISTYHCSILVVIHQNKDNDNARGHLGTELINKSESVVEIKQNRAVFDIKSQCCRDISFEPFTMMFNDVGLPELCDSSKIKKDKKDIKEGIDALSKLFEPIFIDCHTILRRDLKAKIAGVIGQSKKTAERRIDSACTKGVIEKLPNNYYRLVGTDTV